VLLLGLDGDLQQTLERVLGSAQIAVESRDTGNLEIATLQDSTETIFVSGDNDDALELCRKLRLHNATWELPAIVCLTEPTQVSVMHALECGASHVLGVPAEEIDVLRVLRLAQIGEE
jgi:PleD family two-component response regulator